MTTWKDLHARAIQALQAREAFAVEVCGGVPTGMSIENGIAVAAVMGWLLARPRYEHLRHDAAGADEVLKEIGGPLPEAVEKMLYVYATGLEGPHVPVGQFTGTQAMGDVTSVPAERIDDDLVPEPQPQVKRTVKPVRGRGSKRK